MKSVIIKTNITNDSLYCIYSKEKIYLDERYATIYEDYLGDKIEKTYKLKYIELIIDE